MQPSQVTAWVMLSTFVAVILFDLVMFINFGYDATISGVTYDWIQSHSWAPAALAVVLFLLWSHLCEQWPFRPW